jgi:ABC-type multidrug transport system fused ATPase/permease subunit
VLPQALKLVIPGIVNTFIGMFKDTSLVYIIDVRPVGIVRQSFLRCHLGFAGQTPADGPDLRRLRVLDFLLRHVALLGLHGTPARQAGHKRKKRRGKTMANQAQAEKLAVLHDRCRRRITNMNKWYGEFHVLRDINLKVMKGERIVIAGPSGSGKSTMIRCINRLEEHQKGKIVVDGIELTNDLKKIDEVRREVGMVFQHFNLFPHLTILENCTLAPIWVRKMPKKRPRKWRCTT